MGETVAQRQQLRFPPSQAVDQPAAAAQAGNLTNVPPHTVQVCLSVCLLLLLTQLVPEFLVFRGGQGSSKVG